MVLNRRAVVGMTLLAGLPLAAQAQAEPVRVGIVLMHGKGGMPSQLAGEVAVLERQGLLVANLEMPWSKRRAYDVDVPAAEGEVVSALNALRKLGAQKLFVAGPGCSRCTSPAGMPSTVSSPSRRAATLPVPRSGRSWASRWHGRAGSWRRARAMYRSG